jgi:hypothetical protein
MEDQAKSIEGSVLEGMPLRIYTSGTQGLEATRAIEKIDKGRDGSTKKVRVLLRG